jgi:ATP-dependent RNA helicase DDX49/DBP8
MVKKTARRQKSENKEPDDALQGSFLDQDEVLMAMRRIAKGKSRESSNTGSDDSYSSGEDLDNGDDQSLRNRSMDSEDENGAQSSRAGLSSRASTPSAKSNSAEPIPATALLHTKRPQAKGRVVNSSDAPPRPAVATFASLGLSKPIITALEGINILQPTEIQSACIAPMLQGRDVIGGAKTGSGKTLASALPIVERIARDPYGIWAVVLTPTRFEI